MKSHYIGNKSDYNRIAMQVAREEIERQKAEVCPQCEQNVGNQVVAVLLKVLHDQYGFGKRKLQNVMNHATMLFDMCRIDGKKYQATQCVEWLKNEMGIDLERDDND